MPFMPIRIHAFSLALASTLSFASLQAQADTVALWDYTVQSTKQTQSANGASFAALGGVITSFSTGVGAGFALNTSTYAAQGTGNRTRGVQYLIDTSGYTDLVLTFAQRNSATASAWTTLLYTLNGSTWTPAATFEMPAAASTTFVSGLTYNFAGITGANDNPDFGIQLLTSFAPGTTSYAATGAASSYGIAGTIRYDNVLLSGTAIADPVPEPQTYALMLAGLGLMVFVARRRRQP
jgi:PEP-CTERM motif